MIRLLVTLSLTCLFVPTLLALQFMAFDLDNNVFNMPTKMLIKNTKTGQIEELPQSAYAPILHKEAGYDHYEFTPDSFKYSHEDPTGKENYFLNDIKVFLSKKDDQWKGPDWKRFVEETSTAEKAKQVLIITAREHLSSTIIAGLHHLKEQRLIKFLPSEENIWCVNHPQFAEMVKARFKKDLPEEFKVKQDDKRKLFVMQEYLTRLSQDTKAKENLFYFSDDSEKNIITAQKALSAEIKTKNWNNIRLEFNFTSSEKSPVPAYTIIVPPYKK